MSFEEAESLVLQIVLGMGQIMASRIVKFKEALGGMNFKEQLMDVFGMSEEVNERIFEYFEFTTGIHTYIKINHAEVQYLAKYPNINYGSAKVIVAYRQHHDPYKAPDDLKKVRIFTDQWIEKNCALFRILNDIFMIIEKRFCLKCGDPIHGRSDKRFYDDARRNA